MLEEFVQQNKNRNRTLEYLTISSDVIVTLENNGRIIQRTNKQFYK
jgi:hypothetical protein